MGLGAGLRLDRFGRDSGAPGSGGGGINFVSKSYSPASAGLNPVMAITPKANRATAYIMPVARKSARARPPCFCFADSTSLSNIAVSPWCDVSADGYAIRAIVGFRIRDLRFVIRDGGLLIEVFALQLDRRAARDLHHVNNFHHLAVIQCARSFQEDGPEIVGTPIERATQLRLQFAECVRWLHIQRVSAAVIDRHDQRDRVPCRLFRVLLFRDFRVEFVGTRRADDHKDDQQDQQHIDQRRDIDERGGGRPFWVYALHFIYSKNLWEHTRMGLIGLIRPISPI